MQASAPGKIILTGEHAVVYGAPAIAMAVNRYAKTTVKQHHSEQILFNLMDLSYHKSMTVNALKKLKSRLKTDYKKFQEGQFSIRDVIKRPFELSQYAFSTLLEKLQINDRGLHLETESTIPIGCGMGSSAASTLSVIHAISHFHNLNLDKKNYIKLALETENLQHGKSSGIDLQISLEGGCIRYQQGESQASTLPEFTLYVVNTGKPESTSGECIEHCRKKLENTRLLNDFEAVTNSIDNAIVNKNFPLFQKAIQENHKLLTHIDVVPHSVQQFIATIENNGGTAKICGAGACRGSQAGIVLIAMKESPSELCQSFNYQCEAIEGDSVGLQIT